MVRMGDRCVRVGGGKSSGKKGGGGSSSSSTPKSKTSAGKPSSSIGGNPVCPRETPEWQKPITSFFPKTDQAESSSEIAEQSTSNSGASGSKYTTNEEDSDISKEQNKSLVNEVSSSDLTVEEIEELCVLRKSDISEWEDSSCLENTLEEEKNLNEFIVSASSSVTVKDLDESSNPESDNISSEDNNCEVTSTKTSENKTVSKRKRQITESPNSPEYEPHHGTIDNKKTPVKKLKLDESVSENNNKNEEKCNTPTTERKRKSTINVLTPKRIHSRS